jgi:hypothetical protein
LVESWHVKGAHFASLRKTSDDAVLTKNSTWRLSLDFERVACNHHFAQAHSRVHRHMHRRTKDMWWRRNVAASSKSVAFTCECLSACQLSVVCLSVCLSVCCLSASSVKCLFASASLPVFARPVSASVLYVCFCLFLSVSVCYCLFLSLTVCYCLLLSVTVVSDSNRQ